MATRCACAEAYTIYLMPGPCSISGWGFSNVSEVSGKRERKPTRRYDEFQQWRDSLPPSVKASRGKAKDDGAGI